MKRDEFAMKLSELLPRLWAFAWRISRSERDAELVVEQAYRQAFESPINVENERLDKLMFALIYSVWLRRRDIRQSMRESAGEPRIVALASSKGAEDIAHRTIVDALEGLPDGQRIGMLLVTLEGFSCSDAAFVLGMPSKALISQLVEARQMVELARTEQH